MFPLLSAAGINPVLAAGQIEGGIVQGIGFAIYEDVALTKRHEEHPVHKLHHSHHGRHAPGSTWNSSNFLMPITVPIRPKGLAKCPSYGPAPAVAAAVAHALGGNFINEIPLNSQAHHDSRGGSRGPAR